MAILLPNLEEFYRELYLAKFYQRNKAGFRILVNHIAVDVKKNDKAYTISLKHSLTKKAQEITADLVILATGFKCKIPSFLDDLLPEMSFFPYGGPQLNLDYSLKMAQNEEKKNKNKIYMLNFGRRTHGIADPQTSLMAHRSQVILDSLCDEEGAREKRQNDSWNRYVGKNLCEY